MALNIPTEGTKLNELKINIVDTQATFEAMKTAEKVNANELYFIEQELPVVADSLKTGHTFKVNLASNSVSTPFTGEQDISDIGVSGTLPVAQGGTGVTSIANIQAGKDSAGNTITSTYLKLSGGNMTGHIYLTGSQANSSTANTSQLIFGTSTTEHIAISSNTKALILNPTHSSTTNQIVLYLDKASKFPLGIEANIKGNLTGKATTAGTADVANSVAWNNVSSKPDLVNKITTTAGVHTVITNQTGNVSFNVPTMAAHVGAAAKEITVYNPPATFYIKTDFLASGTQNMIYGYLQGNGYGGTPPIHVDFQVYNYTATSLINGKQYDATGAIGQMSCFRGTDGYLYIKVERGGGNQTFKVFIYKMSHGNDENHAIEVLSTAPEMEAGSEHIFTKYTGIHSGFFTSAYDMIYSNASNSPVRLSANKTTTKKFLSMTGTGSAGAAPVWSTVTQSDVGLSNVENTKLSTWTGSSKITTIGTLSSGTVPWARLSNIPTTFTPAAHTHGNITNDGKITGDGTAIGNGDKLVFVDATDNSNIIRKTNIAFDHATKTEFLSKEGSWISPIEYIKGTQTEITNQWTGITKDTTIYQGKVIAYHLPYASAPNETVTCSLTLTLDNGNGNTYGPTSVYEAHSGASGTGTVYLKEIYPAGTVLLLIYNGSRWQIINKKDLNLYEAYLKWGGKNFKNDYGPIDAAMIPDLGANRFAFLKSAGITVEYSTDNGTTWLDYGFNNTQKVGLFGAGESAYLGKHFAKGTANLNDQLRITINTSAAGIYTILNKIAIYMSTNGNTSYVKMDKALENTPDNYITHLDWTEIGGWSGWNILNINDLITYGNTANTQYGRIRFIFKQTSLYKNGEERSANIIRIMGFGGVGWGTPSNMAKDGHIYSYDNNQIATFPNNINITNINNSYKATLNTSLLTANRTFNFPDKAGTIALVSDIPTSFNSSNITGLKTLTIGSNSCQVFADADINIPIYNGTYS